MAHPLLGDPAREEVRKAIVAIERQTGAEIVVAVRRAAGRYREADYLFGFLVAIATLIALLYLPEPIALAFFPLDLAVAFAAGALVSSRSPRLRRWLTPGTVRNAEVRRAACAELVELGLTSTRSRGAVLVYVALLERRVECVLDIGVPVSRLPASWSEALAGLERALAARDVERFGSALRALGPPLSIALPCPVDDVNEIPDEVRG
jgi:putative membrane protein